ncbi:MAG: SurA N-terminal domain-containing protein [Deltaproteobacteria bacterium]|nr:SurA N-terminal domain-containing protein [Deltaproteobacteria bacterium]
MGLVLASTAGVGLAAPSGEVSQPEEVLVDEVVAVVNKHVITLSKVRQESALILVERRGEEGLAHQITKAFMSQVLDFLINQQVLLDEARRVKLPQVSDEEIRRLLSGFKARFLDAETFARFLFTHSMTEDGIIEVLVRHLRVERLKESKVRSIPKLSEAAVRSYYEANQARFGGADYQTVAEAIRHRLAGERKDKELARWVWALRRRAEVKVLVEMAHVEGDAP